MFRCHTLNKPKADLGEIFGHQLTDMEKRS
jgi:hypothetical protein